MEKSKRHKIKKFSKNSVDSNGDAGANIQLKFKSKIFLKKQSKLSLEKQSRMVDCIVILNSTLERKAYLFKLAKRMLIWLAFWQFLLIFAKFINPITYNAAFSLRKDLLLESRVYYFYDLLDNILIVIFAILSIYITLKTNINPRDFSTLTLYAIMLIFFELIILIQITTSSPEISVLNTGKLYK